MTSGPPAAHRVSLLTFARRRRGELAAGSEFRWHRYAMLRKVAVYFVNPTPPRFPPILFDRADGPVSTISGGWVGISPQNGPLNTQDLNSSSSELSGPLS